MSAELTSAEDWRGNRFSVGDKALYPRMAGRSCEMQEGTVLAIVETEVPTRQFDPETRTWATTTRVQRKVKLQPTRSSRQFFRWEKERAVWIQLGENVTAVPQ